MPEKTELEKKPLYEILPSESLRDSQIKRTIWAILTAHKELNVTQISSMMIEVKSTISRHLRQMEEIGLIISRIEDNYPRNRIPPKFYKVNPDISVSNFRDPGIFVNPTSKEDILVVLRETRIRFKQIIFNLDLYKEIYEDIGELIKTGTSRNIQQAYELYQEYLWGKDGENILWFQFMFETRNRFDFLKEYEQWLNKKLNSTEDVISKEELEKFQESWKESMKSYSQTNIPKEYAIFEVCSHRKSLFRYYREVKTKKTTQKKIYKKQPLNQSITESSAKLKITDLDKTGNVFLRSDVYKGEYIFNLQPIFLIGNSEIRSRIWIVLEFYHELNVTQISNRLKEVKSTISRHLNKMEEMGIVDSNIIQNTKSHKIPQKKYKLSEKLSEISVRSTPFPHPNLSNFPLSKSIEYIEQDINYGISAIQEFKHIFSLIEPIFQEIEDLFKRNTLESDKKAKKIFKLYLKSDDGSFNVKIQDPTYTRRWWAALLNPGSIFFFHEMLINPYSENLQKKFSMNKKLYKEALNYDQDRNNLRTFGYLRFRLPRSIFEYYKDKAKGRI